MAFCTIYWSATFAAIGAAAAALGSYRLSMTIRQLTLSDFRNHADLRIAAEPGLMAFTGDNGAGKTNILEAVSLLTPGRGLRRAPLAQMARDDGPGGFAVAAELDPATGGASLGTGTLPDTPGQRRSRINGAAVPTVELGERLSVLWLTPAMDRLFVEPASGRRGFLDRLVTALEPSHPATYARFDHARRERGRLLSEPAMPPGEWLDALEQQLARHGAQVAAARRRTVDALAEALATGGDNGFPAATLSLDDQDLVDEDMLRAALRDGRAADRRAGRTLAGPHRADLSVRHAGKDRDAASCSTGEQKALLFSIVLAHADAIARRQGRRPVLLLDEVAAHLDPDRRAALFARLQAAGGQSWLTGTEAALFADAPAPLIHYTLADGALERL